MVRNLTKKQLEALDKRCYKLYCKGGASAVYDYANDHPDLIPQWRFCEPCDAYVPVVFTNKKNEKEHADCLVCGSTIDLRMCVELVMWEDVRKDMQYPETDDNEGYIHGVNLLQLECDEVLEVSWFQTEELRAAFIKENNYKIIND